MEGVTTFEKRSERIVLEANTDYWDHAQFPRVQRIVFDNTLSPKEALELVKTGEGHVDLVNELRPLETLRVAESPFAKVVKQRGSLRSVFGQFNMRQAGGLGARCAGARRSTMPLTARISFAMPPKAME